VGLSEAALQYVGAGTLSFFTRLAVSTPLELFWETEPVPNITIDCDEEVVIPVYGVVVDPRSPYVATSFRGWYSRKQPYELKAIRLPPGATFTPDGKNCYVFRWKPRPEDAGKTVSVEWEMRAEPKATLPVGGQASLGQEFASRRLLIDVHACGQTSPTPTPSPMPTATPSPTPSPSPTPAPTPTPTPGQTGFLLQPNPAQVHVAYRHGTTACGTGGSVGDSDDTLILAVNGRTMTIRQPSRNATYTGTIETSGLFSCMNGTETYEGMLHGDGTGTGTATTFAGGCRTSWDITLSR
jgi:hypothetical protein